VRCDALLVDTISRSDTYPANDIREDDVSMGHEATVSQISAEQLFYLQSRGMEEDEAMAMIVRGFIEPIAKEVANGIRTRAEQANRDADGRSCGLVMAQHGIEAHSHTG
jgi:Fe-S cluster assembly scaffold protein SufB